MNINVYTSKNLCVACNTSQFLQFYAANHAITLSNNQVLNFKQNLECCYKCGLVRQENNESYSDSNLNKYYSYTFRTPLNPESLKKEDKRIGNAKKRLAFISKLKKTGTLLEVGFGDGIFLKTAAKKYSCTGLDPSSGYKYLHEYLTKQGIEVLEKPLEKYSSKKSFDIVCSFLVLEHIKDPLSFIRSQIKHLKRNGIIIVEVPDIRKYAAFNSESVLTYEHVYHYCVESLSLLLSKLNLALIASDNKNVSYGFSLIAAFRVSEKSGPAVLVNGFSVLELFQQFIEKRKRYQQQMAATLSSIIKEVKDNARVIGLYGTGFLFNYAIDFCGLDMNNIDLLFDDTNEKSGKVSFGKIIRPLADIDNHRPSVLIIFSEMFFEPMKQNVLKFINNEDVEIINIHQLSS